jgi:hypothetical protein
MKVCIFFLFKPLFIVRRVDRSTGDRLLLPAIKKLVDDDDSLQNLSKEQEREFIDKLKAHRDLKKTGIRKSNRSAAADTRYTVERLESEVCPPNLHTSFEDL